ncbi:hypothetical protein [Microvirga arabica]|uniref:hypothetical protein n=1 Tax=Microvirga arabica TaxID=1128671 RepID=UPI0019395F46|nr:hypothetical protein [Microvirga arabica]MBM1174369.1 hypothetical protein [Microvirga arabica]
MQKSLSDGALWHTIVAVPEDIPDDDNLLLAMIGQTPAEGQVSEWSRDLDETYRIAAAFDARESGTA